MRHLKYLQYVLRHKWFVFVASLRIGAPVWRSIIHDWSKFLVSEWFPYAYTFYTSDGSSRYHETADFNMAWNYHQKRNKHHWQYWLLKFDQDKLLPLPMPRKYIMEMVADWMGAGRAINGKWECQEWYEENKKIILLHSETRRIVETVIFEYK